MNKAIGDYIRKLSEKGKTIDIDKIELLKLLQRMLKLELRQLRKY